ncbi:hypothetical protein G7Z17_g13513 [Cylindrodendrum hubeiense]|uniref:Uncharacterized protein n=1 Tax=Cylindrodendrum hubeiense TaxID=595255 RepID=A0A9P5GWV7_9HYPO|nr:hypothetical protein G7Z17_g13513 [Cylindrodendrum hubeiense]
MALSERLGAGGQPPHALASAAPTKAPIAKGNHKRQCPDLQRFRQALKGLRRGNTNATVASPRGMGEFLFSGLSRLLVLEITPKPPSRWLLTLPLPEPETSERPSTRLSSRLTTPSNTARQYPPAAGHMPGWTTLATVAELQT